MSNLAYWESVYRKSRPKNLNELKPSQFAAFCLGELPPDAKVIDCGCGNARDSVFFTRYGLQVIGLDGSEAAVALGEQLAAEHRLDGLSFTQLDFSNRELVLGFASELAHQNEPFSIYSRFFLHAIEPEEQDNFFSFCAEVCHTGMKVFLEFRTAHDMALHKEMSEHYRRFIQPEDISSALQDVGFKVSFLWQGQGFAKYQAEDAHVCRMIAEPMV